MTMGEVVGFCSFCGKATSGGPFCVSCGKTLPPDAQGPTLPNSFGQGPINQYQPSGSSGSNTLSILGMVLGGVAVLFFPIFFGVAGIVLAVIAKSKNEAQANLALGISIGGTVLGFILGFANTASFYY
jgi:hypothetical protein